MKFTPEDRKKYVVALNYSSQKSYFRADPIQLKYYSELRDHFDLHQSVLKVMDGQLAVPAVPPPKPKPRRSSKK